MVRRSPQSVWSGRGADNSAGYHLGGVLSELGEGFTNWLRGFGKLLQKDIHFKRALKDE